jgi:myo-inositol 2-dehydrogenase/D-chiro-inositol 1-dehydrogenase
MAAEKRFGVLLVAGGFTHQENYGPGFAADPRCRIIGVTDEAGVDERRARWNRRLAEEMRVPYLPDLARALERSDVHIASICTEHERQGRVGVACARAGKHIYMDKPVAGSLEDARRLVEAIRQAGVRSQMFSQVNLPYALRARQAVESGRIGEIKAIHCDLHFAKGPAGTAALGEPRKETAVPTRFFYPDAKRELFNIGVYPLALIRWLTRREVLSVSAVTANYFFEEHQRRDFEDFGMMALALEDGLNGTITAGRIGWSSHFGSGPNLTRLYGTAGSMLIDAFEPRFEVAADHTPWQPPPRDPDDPMGFWRSTQEKAGIRPRPEWIVPQTVAVRSDQSLFVDAIEQQREAEVTVMDGARILEVLFAAYQSAATGVVVRMHRS